MLSTEDEASEPTEPRKTSTTNEQTQPSNTRSRTERKDQPYKASGPSNRWRACQQCPHMLPTEDEAFEPTEPHTKRTKKYTTSQDPTNGHRTVNQKDSCQKQPDYWPRMKIEEGKLTDSLDQPEQSNQQSTSPQVTHIDNRLEDERFWDWRPKFDNNSKKHTPATKQNTHDNNTTSPHYNNNTTHQDTHIPTDPPPPSTHTPAYTQLTVWNTRYVKSCAPTHSPRLPHPYEDNRYDWVGSIDTLQCILKEPSIILRAYRLHLRRPLATARKEKC